MDSSNISNKKGINNIENKVPKIPLKNDRIKREIVNEEDYYTLLGYKKGLKDSRNLNDSELKEYIELIDEKLFYLSKYYSEEEF